MLIFGTVVVISVEWRCVDARTVWKAGEKYAKKTWICKVRFVNCCDDVCTKDVDYVWRLSRTRLVRGCGWSTTAWSSNRRATAIVCTWPVTMATLTTLSTTIAGLITGRTGCPSARRTSTTTSCPSETAPWARNAAGGSTGVRRRFWPASAAGTGSRGPSAAAAWCCSAVQANLTHDRDPAHIPMHHACTGDDVHTSKIPDGPKNCTPIFFTLMLYRVNNK